MYSSCLFPILSPLSSDSCPFPIPKLPRQQINLTNSLRKKPLPDSQTLNPRLWTPFYKRAVAIWVPNKSCQMGGQSWMGETLSSHFQGTVECFEEEVCVWPVWGPLGDGYAQGRRRLRPGLEVSSEPKCYWCWKDPWEEKYLRGQGESLQWNPKRGEVAHHHYHPHHHHQCYHHRHHHHHRHLSNYLEFYPWSRKALACSKGIPSLAQHWKPNQAGAKGHKKVTTKVTREEWCAERPLLRYKGPCLPPSLPSPRLLSDLCDSVKWAKPLKMEDKEGSTQPFQTNAAPRTQLIQSWPPTPPHPHFQAGSLHGLSLC